MVSIMPPPIPERIKNSSINTILFVDIHFMLPSGLYLSLKSCLSSTLSELKEKLFQEISNNPINRILKHKNFYILMGVNKNGERQECLDESKKLSELELYRFYFKLIERIGNIEEKILDGKIGLLIDKPLTELNKMASEVQDCRKKLAVTVERVLKQRSLDNLFLAKYYYPSKISSGEILPHHLIDCLTSDGNFMFEAKFYISNDGKSLSKEQEIMISALTPVNHVVFNVLHPNLPFENQPDVDHVIKIVGHNSYFLDVYVEIIRYHYIRNALIKGEKLRFVIVPLSFLYSTLPKFSFNRPLYMDSVSPPDKSTISQWSLPKNLYYSIKINSVNHINAPDGHLIQLQACLYHGSSILSEIVSTPEFPQEVTEWNTTLDFKIPLCDLPRATKLCFTLMSISDIGKGLTFFRSKKQTFVTLGWSNMMVMNYRGIVETGNKILNFWSYDDEPENSFNVIGTPIGNDIFSLSRRIVKVKIYISPFHSNSIMYPHFDYILDFAVKLNPNVRKSREYFEEISQDVKFEIDRILRLDRLSELDEQMTDILWNNREYCSTRNDSLPKLLRACNWSVKENVAEMRVLLDRWPEIDVNTALELLDHTFADPTVRAFATKNLNTQLNDDQFQEYLLQLVQALKYEPYLYCQLSDLLLKRALWNADIGHFLFWHLRAEMHLPEVSVRFGVLLEAYCRGAGTQLEYLDAQLRSIKNMKTITENLQQSERMPLTKLKELLHEALKNKLYVMPSLLHPCYELDGLIVDNCKSMNSKMKPLWLVFKNKDHMGNSVFLMFKNGDDLRQDMLTIQMFRIMDQLWQDQGLDLRLTPYGCLSTGDRIGMIELVLESFTLAKIHRKYGGGARGAFRTNTLYSHLQQQNPSEVLLENATKNFTLSCAGYCVATYVLGIGDRHSDNIMLKNNGQLFHIDFGHFLGNFKSKFGYKRERVPFVLTKDFLFIISKGCEHTESSAKRHMTAFRNLCEKAFLILRQKGDLFINLLAMMLSTGIPELRTVEDISYMKEALFLEEADDVAREMFRSKFTEAINNSFTVSINWYIHGIAKK